MSEQIFQYEPSQLSHFDDGRIPVFLTDEQYIRAKACVTACSGSSTEWLKFIISDECIDEFGGPVPFETRHGEILSKAVTLMLERDKAEQQRDKLLAMLKEASNEYKRPPHSLGYDITHCDRWDELIDEIELSK